MAESKKSVRLYEDEIDALLDLDDDGLARIMRSILCECLDREQPELKGAEKALYKTVLGQVRRDRELSAARKESGAKGGKSKPTEKQTEPSENQIEPNGKQNQANDKQSEPNESTNTNTNTITNTNTDSLSAKPRELSAVEKRFIEFWAAYPKKVAKGAALKAWKRLKPSQELTEKMIAAIQRQKASDQWTREGGRFIPNPATWLNAERWEDEIGGGNNAETVGNPREYSAEQYTEGFITDDD